MVNSEMENLVCRDKKISKKTRRIFINLIFLISALIFFLILMEIILRFFYPVAEPLFNGDNTLGYKHIPNKSSLFVFYEDKPVKLKFNSEGFRDIEHKIENKEGKKRIIFLGDSFIDSMEVDFNDTFNQLVRKELEKEYPGQFEVFNFAVAGFSTAQEYLTYKYYAEKYGPDIVYIFFFSNDLEETCQKSSYKPTYYIENGEVKQNIFKPRMHSALEFFITDHFKTSVFYRNKYYEIKRQLLINKDVDKDKIRDVYKVFLKDYDPETEECWKIIHYFYKNLKKDVEGSGGKLKVFIPPAIWVVYNDSQENMLKEETTLDKSYFDFNKPYNELEKILKQENISYFNLLEPIQSRKEKLYYEKDAHLNRLGHRVVAEVILKEMKKDKEIK